MSVPELVEPPSPVASFDEAARRARYVVRPPAVIFDMDGTLVDVAGIRHYVLADPKKKDFDSFHAASVFCPPHGPVLELARVLAEAGIAIVVLTSRSWKWHPQTVGWLTANGVEHEMLAMRPEDDYRKDAEVKRDLLAVVRERFTVVMAVDDNPAIIALWNEEGIPVVTWPSWDSTISSQGLTSTDQAPVPEGTVKVVFDGRGQIAWRSDCAACVRQGYPAFAPPHEPPNEECAARGITHCTEDRCF